MSVVDVTRRSGTWLAVPLGLGLIVAACAPQTATPAEPAPPAGQPTAAAPAPQTPTVVPPIAAPTGRAGAAAAAEPEEAPAGRGRGRGNPPPPPPAPPAVMPAAVRPIVSATAPSPDPRVGLRAGYWDAGQAAWNMRLASTTPPPATHLGFTNSDLAFTGKYVVQGNYNGFLIYDITNPAAPRRVTAYICPASQNDVSVYGNLLFVSAEALNGRVDCGTQGVAEPVSKDRMRGVRIFDISDIANPKLVKNVQTCRGSHTHTVVTDPNDKEHVYVYVSGSSGVRPAEELEGCVDGQYGDPQSARFRIEVIKVPLKNPAAAAITSSPRIFQDLAPAPRNPERDAAGRTGGAGRGGQQQAAAGGGRAGAAAGGAAAAGAAAGGGRGGGRGGPPTGPNQCHDITTYPEVGLAGGACGGYGLLLDIRETAYPVRIDAAADMNMAFWHSATFSNDGTKVLFTDEWGGGGQPRCRDTDKYEWGANALFTIERGKLVFQSYYKMPAAQTSLENCVAHNGSLIPIPGREVMVQGWYQGGISVFDWTDAAKPFEIAFFDRGPLNPERMQSAGSWSVYWYNGRIYSSEIARGLDIYELVASGLVTQNELDAAATVQFVEANAQEQKKIVWPPSFAMARAFVDQLERSRGLAAARIATVRAELSAAERLSGADRRAALTRLAGQLTGEAGASSDGAKVRMLATSVTDLANAR